MASLLPPLLDNERWQFLEQLLLRLDEIDRSRTITLLVDVTHESALDHLADQFSLFDDGWNLAQTTDAKRALIKQAIELHRHKGTLWAVKETLLILGFGECDITERINFHQHNRVLTHNGQHLHGFSGSWADYRVTVNQALSRRQGRLIRQTLDNIAPARCLLRAVNYTQIPHDGRISHNAAYAYGAA